MALSFLLYTKEIVLILLSVEMTMPGKLTVAAKLYLLVGVLMVFMLGQGGSALYNLMQNDQRFRTTFEDRLHPLTQLKIVADRYAVNIVDTTHKVRNGGMPAAEGLKRVRTAQHDVRQEWRVYIANALTAEEAGLAKEAGTRMQAADAAIQRLEHLLQANDIQGVADFAAVALYPAIDPVSDIVSELSALQLRVAAVEYQAARDQVRHAEVMTAVLLLVALGVGIGCSYIIVRGLIRQLGAEPDEARLAAQAIASGNLTHEILLLPGDQRSVMAGIAQMRDELKRLVVEIQSSVGAVGTTAGALQSSMVLVSQASGMQADAASQMAAAVEEISASIGEVSSNAEHADAAGKGAGQAAIEGEGRMSQVIAGVGRIGEQLDRAGERLALLDARSGDIASIVATIREIAEQTNLLALNAAIEAARAGESGRGFAVVADEVRKLAERVGLATHEIGATLSVIRDGTSEASAGMQLARADTISEIQNIHLLQDSMQRIRSSGEQLGHVVELIAGALREQRVVSGQIASQVEKVAQMIEENSSAVSEVSSATSRLAELASRLAQSAARFRCV
ncbi:methyl-accepting chemotaxis protein [Jeongeupia wiesaeckerbachi]|uniref:methyl-accepting chemotaxis protein n=1 Tax=Jeongeupia wiesaeckerbachi TaxID=3051218 RepID=UPI003D800C62